MQKHYACPQQGRTLLLTLVMFLLAPLSMFTFGQAVPCLNDTEVPVFQNCPSDITLTTTSTCAVATWAEPTATDNCTPPSVSSDYSGGFCFPIGSTKVTYTAVDSTGNVAICTFFVQVTDANNPCANDIEPPVFTNGCPTYINMNLTDPAVTCLVVNWAEPMVSDNCSTPMVTSNYSSGHCFTGGLTIVTYTAADTVGNTSTCSFAVSINRPISCAVSNNLISKSCANNLPVLSGSILMGHEFMWLQSTTGCPTQVSQAILGAKSQNYTLPNRVTTTTYFIRCARPMGCSAWSIGNQSNCIVVNPNECAPLIIVRCEPASSNTISKSCANNLPVLTGTPLVDHEYAWFMSTTGCPTQADLLIAGAIGQNYTLPSRPTVTTYFIRCARPIGCTTWGTINQSNCITVNANECAPVGPCDTKVNGCFTVSLQSAKRLADGKLRFEYKITNSCKYALSHVAFALPSKAIPEITSSYTGSTGRTYSVEKTTNNPYYSIKFNTNGEGITTGQSEIFSYTLPANAATQASIKVEVKAATSVYNFVMTNCTSINSSQSDDYISLQARAESAQARIEWVNNTGYKNDFFIVEKMNPTTGIFEKLELKNSIFSTSPEHYVAYDKNPMAGENLYRVATVYNDGTTKYSDTKKVDFKPMVTFSVFPNPATDELNINLSEYTGKAVNIEIYNTFGKAVSREHLDNVASPSFTMNVNDLPVGTYLIRVSALGKRDATKQVVIQK
jgi:hypothetical protein